MYIADWSFQKRLKKQDSKLFAKWIHKDPRGRVKDRWAIFRIQPSDNKLYNRYWMVMWVQNEDGSYRPLDERTLRALRQADTHVRGVNTIVDEAISEQEKTQEAIQAADYASWGYLESLESLRPKFGLQPTVGTPYMEGLAMMVCSGRFIAYLPTHFADRWVKSGDMRALLPRKTGRVVDVHLVTHKGDSHSRIVELFKQRIAARSQADATHPYAAALASA